MFGCIYWNNGKEQWTDDGCKVNYYKLIINN